MVSATNTEIRQLLKRGLVIRQPKLRLMDESFRRFVLAAADTEDYVKWQREGRHSNWEAFRIPVVLLILTLGVFLFLTQREFFNSTISSVSAVTGVLAVLLRLVGVFRHDKAPAGDG